MSFIFGALLEFVFVNYIARQARSARTNNLRLVEIIDSSLEERPTLEPLVLDKEEEERDRSLFEAMASFGLLPSRIDYIARFAYPLLFLAFNFLYWATYMPGTIQF